MGRRRRTRYIPIGQIIFVILLLVVTNEPWSWAVAALLLLFVFWPSITRFNAKRRRLRTSNIDEVNSMSGPEFERLLADRFRREGWRVSLTPKYSDYGADLILERPDEKVVVQAKRHQSTVGISAVQQVIGAKEYYRADRALVVTNSFFTANSEELAASSGVMLWVRQTLQGFLADTAVYSQGQPEVAAADIATKLPARPGSEKGQARRILRMQRLSGLPVYA